MPAPVGIDPALKDYLDGLEDRLALVENPKAPTPLFPVASARLTVANALTNINRQVFVTDLNSIAHSDGAHWRREDTGEVIV